MTKKTLGRGLGSLIPENNKKYKAIVRFLWKKFMREDQPRKNFDDKSLEGLSQSIEKYGSKSIVLKNGIR
ncbi:MAG: hypothetical protein ACLTA5_04025 [Anaerococcus obesiensis]